MTSGLGEKLSRWVKLLLSYMLSVLHDEAYFIYIYYYSHISSAGYQIHGMARVSDGSN